MRTEIIKANPKTESAALAAFDKRIFSAEDCFPKEEWKTFECYWLIVDGAKVGSVAMKLHCDVEEPPEYSKSYQGCLYICSTGILPEFQGKKLGELLKVWEIAYAIEHGFERIVTNCRETNYRIINLNEKFGFKVVRRIPDYYSDPKEHALVFELVF